MTRIQHFLIGGAGGGDRLADAGLLVLRLFAGLALAFGHGVGKIPPQQRSISNLEGWGFPVPEAWAWLSTFAEFGAALLLAIGLLTRPAATVIVINFLVALVFAHFILGDTYRGMALALFFFFTAICFLCTGAGRYSVDGMLRTRVESRVVSRYAR